MYPSDSQNSAFTVQNDHRADFQESGFTSHDRGWRRLIGSPKLQIIFHKRATKCRSLLQKMTYKDKVSYESSPPCVNISNMYSSDSQNSAFTTLNDYRANFEEFGFSVYKSDAALHVSICVCVCVCVCVCFYSVDHIDNSAPFVYSPSHQ